MGTKDFNIFDILIAHWRFQKIVQHVNSSDVILDLGCGSQAYFLRTIQKKVKIGIGIDYDVEEKTIEKNIRLKKFYFKKKLPFTDKFFDKIFLLAVIEHIEAEKIKFLFSELFRILKKNGKVILTTPTPRSKQLLELLAFRLHIISEMEIADHKKYYSKEDLEKIAHTNKFVVSEYKTFQFGLNSLCILDKT